MTITKLVYSFTPDCTNEFEIGMTINLHSLVKIDLEASKTATGGAFSSACLLRTHPNNGCEV